MYIYLSYYNRGESKHVLEPFGNGGSAVSAGRQLMADGKIAAFAVMFNKHPIPQAQFDAAAAGAKRAKG